MHKNRHFKYINNITMYTLLRFALLLSTLFLGDHSMCSYLPFLILLNSHIEYSLVWVYDNFFNHFPDSEL